ncbi:MAG: hypothetical protein ABIT82_05095 [Ramlibacter sp.]
MIEAKDHSPRPADALLLGLRDALRAQGHAAASAPLERLRDKGLAHDHVRLCGTGMLARVPKQSQMNLPPTEALAYEAACFERAAPAGGSPALQGLLPVSARLPRGCLLVREIEGRCARLPGDLRVIAHSLAGLHGLALPEPAARLPLLAPPDALRALLQEINSQWAQGAGCAPAGARAAVEDGLRRLQGLVQASARPQVRLIAFDAHPGNFIVDGAGRAWLVDLEKCRYAYPGLDLAHATLYTSTSWDLDTRAALSVPEVLSFYAAWHDALSVPWAEEARHWHAPLRRAMWLWSLTWCAKWQALSARPARSQAGGEDWSGERSDATLVAHVRDRVHHYQSAGVVQQMDEELHALERAWA